MNPAQTAALITALQQIAVALETIAAAQPKPVDRDIQLPHRPSWVTDYPR